MRAAVLLLCAHADGIGIGSLHGAATSPLPADHPGAVIYRNMCLECHGKTGEGVAGKYDEPLHGDRNLASLTKRIERTMPEGKEGTCIGPDAANVAEYIYHSFYSVEARARNLPAPERDLTHLTNDQFRVSVADLFARFRQPLERLPKERGLKASYNGFEIEPPPPILHGPPRRGQKSLEPTVDPNRQRPRTRMNRVDAELNFRFGASSPDPEKMASDEFSIRWDGSLIVEETGVYEFILKTENGVRLAINETEKSLIDAWVTPGPDIREEKKSIFLLGGRVYPITVEFFKLGDKSASLALQWKPPHGVQQTIPSRHLIPQRGAEVMVLATSFPADDQSDGYIRGTGISKAWDQATTDAAIEAAEYAEKRVDRLAGTKPDALDRVQKLREFARRFAEAALRRPMTPEEERVLIDVQFAKAATPEVGVKRTVMLSLKSPQFLYPALVEQGDSPAYRIATRLALDLWDSIPDKRLLEAAASGRLLKREEVAAQATRMLPDPRTKSKLRGFLHHWLELERAEMISKDAKSFPGFDREMISDLRESLWMFLDDVIWSERSDYRELLQANYLMLNKRLAAYYGVPPGAAATESEFKRVSFDSKQRTGVLTHPYLLTSFAYTKHSSPIHRGVFLTRNIVGIDLKAPPDDVEFDDAHFNPKLTMREKVTELTKSGACMGCHSTINSLGFSLENYDAVGRFRTKDNNKPVDAVTEFETQEGKTLTLTGPRDIAQYAATTPSGHLAFIRHLFNHTVKQPHLAHGQDTLEKLRVSFEGNAFSIQKLLKEIAITSALAGTE